MLETNDQVIAMFNTWLFGLEAQQIHVSLWNDDTQVKQRRLLAFHVCRRQDKQIKNPAQRHVYYLQMHWFLN